LLVDLKEIAPTKWTDGFWVDAWVFALFDMHNAHHVFTNAWTTVQENKPKMLELKMLYETAAANPGQRVVILTAFAMSEACGLSKALAESTNANLKTAQEELGRAP
jgi:hypothetical protein